MSPDVIRGSCVALDDSRNLLLPLARRITIGSGLKIHLSWFKDQRLRKKIEDLDAPLFAAMAYPETGRGQLLTLAKFIAWVWQSFSI